MEEPPLAQSVLQTRSSNLQVRASKIIQKVSNFRGRIRLSTRKTKDDRDMHGPYMRQSRSMDVHAKPYMSQPMLGLSSMPTDGDDSSSVSPNHSPSRNESRQIPPLIPPYANRLPRHSISTGLVSGTRKGVVSGGRGASLDGLPSVSEGPSHPLTTIYPSDASNNLTNQEHRSAGPHIVVSKPSLLPRGTSVDEPSSSVNPPRINESTGPLVNTTPAQSNYLHNDSVSSLIPPFGSIPISTSSSPQPTTITYSSSPKLPSTSSPTGHSTSTPAHIQPNPTSTFPPRRVPAPRLNGLPLPLPLHRFSLSLTDSGTARLSPSIITRQAPMPILHLPTLPTFSSPSTEPEVEREERERANHKKAGSQARLRSMPALPIQGTAEGAGVDAGDGDMDDEGDDEEMDDDEEASDMGHRDLDMPVDMDEDEGIPRSSMSSENSSMPPQSQSRSPSPSNTDSSLHMSDNQRDLQPLPHVDTSRINLSFLNHPPDRKRKGKEREHEHQRGRESESTPTASRYRHRHQYQHDDYFSSSHDGQPPDLHNNTGESSSRTPRPGDVFRVPRFVVGTPNTMVPIPPIPPMQPMSSSGRPGIHKQASKSMVDILALTKREMTEEDVVTKERKAEAGLGRQATVKGKGKANAREDSEATVTAPGTVKADSTEEPTTPAYETNAFSHPLRRRRSMPTFTAASQPPPYPTFAPHPFSHPMRPNITIQPRDDELEGKERLPCYSNDIYLKAIMPRKMEFTKPGVQAKDRKWRRVICVLEGTAFRVYSCPPRVAGVGIIGEWWEKKVGAGDVTLEMGPGTEGARGRGADTRRERGADVNRTEPVAKLGDGRSGGGGGNGTGNEDSQSELQVRPRSPQPPSQSHFQPQPQVLPKPQASRSRFNLAVNLLKPHSRSQSDVPNPPKPRAASRSLSILRPSLAGSSSASVSDSASGHSNTHPNSPSLRPSPSNLSIAVSIPSSVSTSISTPTTGAASSSSSRSLFPGAARTPRNAVSALSPMPTTTIPEPDPANLIKLYTLQHAESGLGSDYTKRQNVIRVRMEGEQFLLQAKDVVDVVEWIEGFTAATNIALDLDERVMPKGPLFPRRRRRRARTDNERGNNSQSQQPDNRTTSTT